MTLMAKLRAILFEYIDHATTALYCILHNTIPSALGLEDDDQHSQANPMPAICLHSHLRLSEEHQNTLCHGKTSSQIYRYIPAVASLLQGHDFKY